MLRYASVGLLCVFAWACLSSVTAKTVPGGRIVGGYPANITQYPHQISMRYNGRHRCGGSIYSPTLIVSAAHCVIGVDASLLSIVAGSTFLNDKKYELPVVKYIMHEKYRQINFDYDVAILVVRGRFPFNDYIKPIPLARQRAPVGSVVTITGWGTLSFGGSGPNELQQVQVYVYDQDDCRKAYRLTYTSRMMCAAVPEGGKDACQGDSGGPLVYNNELLGIVSNGRECALADYPGIYASVPDLYEWIVENTKAETKDYSFI